MIPDAVRIFVVAAVGRGPAAPPGKRGTESADEQAKRNLDAEAEMARAADSTYVVVNETDQPEATADQIEQIIRHEHERAPDRQIKL